jgi:alkylation response protein AidB-like acyl-CoA dehydrogenase
LRERERATEALHRVPDDSIDELRSAGLFRLFQPVRYGGYELDYGIAQLEVGKVLGAACGSTAWVQGVLAAHAWILGMFPESAQDAVWGKSPATALSTAVSATTGHGQVTPDGIHVEGEWEFSSGVDAADWVIFLVRLDTAEPQPPVWCLVPIDEVEILDNWDAMGLQGTGSKNVRVPGIDVPADRVLHMGSGSPPGTTVNRSYMYRLPLLPVFGYNLIGTALGIAHGVLQDYISESAARPDRAAHVGRQLRLSETAAELDAAELLLRADAAEIKRLGESGEPISQLTQVRWYRNLSYAAMVFARGSERLMASVGGHGILNGQRVQRAWRDLHTVANHAGLVWENHGPGYASLVLGVEPPPVGAAR